MNWTGPMLLLLFAQLSFSTPAVGDASVLTDAAHRCSRRKFLLFVHRYSMYALLTFLCPCASADMLAETGHDLLVLCEEDYDRCSESVAWTISGIQVGIMGTLGLQFGDTSLTEVMNRKAYKTLYGCRPANMDLNAAAEIVIAELRSDRSSDLLTRRPAASILFALGRSFPCPQ